MTERPSPTAELLDEWPSETWTRRSSDSVGAPPIQYHADLRSMMFETLYRQACAVVSPRKLSDSADAGGVGAALLTASGSVYTGVCIDTACSMGFCAEHAAAAAMITAGENQVVKMVAVNSAGSILPPCGRCREFISQLHPDNLEAEVLIASDRVATLRELLPHDWRNAMARPE